MRKISRHFIIGTIAISTAVCGCVVTRKADRERVAVGVTSANRQRVLAWLAELPVLHDDTLQRPEGSPRIRHEQWLAEGRTIPHIEPVLRELLPEHDAKMDLPKIAYALGWLGNRDSIPPLINALADSDVALRIEAAAALGRLRDSAAVPALCRAAVNDSDANVRANGCAALGNIGDRRALPTLETASRDKHPFVAELATEARRKITPSR